MDKFGQSPGLDLACVFSGHAAGLLVLDAGEKALFPE
jgi:hypothetical protein